MSLEEQLAALQAKVQYLEDRQAVLDLVTGRVHLMLASMVSFMPYVKAGKLAALGVGRLEALGRPFDATYHDAVSLAVVADAAAQADDALSDGTSGRLDRDDFVGQEAVGGEGCGEREPVGLRLSRAACDGCRPNRLTGGCRRQADAGLRLVEDAVGRGQPLPAHLAGHRPGPGVQSLRPVEGDHPHPLGFGAYLDAFMAHGFSPSGLTV